MKDGKLEMLTVNIPGIHESDPKCTKLERAEEALRLSKLVASEIEAATKKISAISSIDGQSVNVVRLELAGKMDVETYTLSFVCNGKEIEKTYNKQDFYKL